MIALAVILNFVAGALWRRWLGGWLGGERWWRFAAMPLLAWPLWLTLPWWAALVATGLCGLFFAIGHTVETPWKRYGPFGVAYWLPMKLWRAEWNRPPLIDGGIAVGELLLGGLFWGAVACVLFAA